MKTKYSILIVDDIPENIDLLVGVLENEYNLQTVTNGETALKIINSSNQPDLILLDVMMPTMDGYEVAQKIKSNPSTQHIPIIFVTAKSDAYDEEKGFHLGAADYITKPINPPLVLARVNTHLSISDLNRKLAYEVDKLKDELELRYTSDELTGFRNIRGLQNDLDTQRKKSLLLLDISRMHEINEHYGYQAGDSILKQVAQEIRHTFNSRDITLYRTHGDQFAVLSHSTSSIEFEESVTQFIKTLDLKLFPLKEDDNTLTVSIQVCAGFVKDSDRDILTKASMALHQSKKENLSLVVHSFDGYLKSKKSIEVISNLYDAILENRIEVRFQPIIDNASQQIVKYETLVRSIKNDGTITLPYIFLEAAKRARLYPFLTREVIDQAFEQFKDRNEEVSINISWDDISNPITREYILNRLDHYPTPHKVLFELVESQALNDSLVAKEFLHALKQKGCKLAIDDFGSGFSNFEYLIHIQADIIKIDGSLIKDIDTNPHKRAIVKSIVSFAQDLEIETVAEYVSKKEIFDVIKEMGITYSQGFLFGKPQKGIH